MEWNKADYQSDWRRATSGGAFVKYYQNGYESQIKDSQGNLNVYTVKEDKVDYYKTQYIQNSMY